MGRCGEHCCCATKALPLEIVVLVVVSVVTVSDEYSQCEGAGQAKRAEARKRTMNAAITNLHGRRDLHLPNNI